MKFEDVRRLLAPTAERVSPAGLDEGEPAAASVAVVLRAAAAGSELLFIRRAEREGDPWSGHIAFPGGRREPDDATSRAVAVRETLEEVGLDLERAADLLIDLPKRPTFGRTSGNSMLVQAYVFALRVDAPLAPNAEVAEVLWVPLARLLAGEGRATFTYEHEGTAFRLPCIDIGPYRLWGLTLRMVDDLVSLLSRG